jgi:hypothetical protein
MSSKFKNIFDQAKTRESETPAKETSHPSPALPVMPASEKKRGRPSGKRSDADYVQVTAYVNKDTHRDVKIALLKAGKGKDFSELVDDLLGHWLKSRT